MSEPIDLASIEKLRFILNRDIQPMVAPASAIAEAINHYDGQVEGESVDCMLPEFMDTAIEFTETESDERLSLRDQRSSACFADTENDRLLSVELPVEDRILDDIDDMLIDDFPKIFVSGIVQPGFVAAAAKTRARNDVRLKRVSNESPAVKCVNQSIEAALLVHATHLIIEIDDHGVHFSLVIQEAKKRTRSRQSVWLRQLSRR